MEVEDIYGDLGDFNLADTISKFEENNKVLAKTVEESEKRISVLANEVSTLKKVNQDLKVNISELYKTAKGEIERKSRQITDLRRELDDTVYRRSNKNNSATVHKDSEKKGELIKQLNEARNVLEQKNRIINSLNKELENVKAQKSDLKRNSSHIINETDDTIYKRQKNGNFERDNEHFDGSRGHWKSNYKPKEFDERRNRSGSRSPDRQPGNRRNSGFRPVNDRRLNKLKDRYDSRDQCNERQFYNRFKFNKNEYDHRKPSNSHSRSPEFLDRQAGKGQNNKFAYCNYTSSECSNRSETSYNSRISIDDRREDNPAWCEKTNETVQNNKFISKRTIKEIHPLKCSSSISKKPQKNENYRRKDLEEGELDRIIADKTENSMNVNSMESNILINPATSSDGNKKAILKEDIRNIVTVADILDEGKSKDKLMNTFKTECVNSDKKIEDLNTISGSSFKITCTDDSSASTSNCYKTNANIKLIHKSSTKVSDDQKPTEPCIDHSFSESSTQNPCPGPSTSEQVTHPCIDASFSEPLIQNCIEVSTSNQAAQPCIDASLSEPSSENHTSRSTSEQPTYSCIDVSLSEPPTHNRTELSTGEQLAQSHIDTSLTEPSIKNHTDPPTSDQPFQISTDASHNEFSVLNPTDSSISGQSSQNSTQPIAKRKITGRRRRCVISIT